MMKLLIAYDGSECSDQALYDLKRAGLSNQTQAEVVTIADVLLPPEGPVDPSLPKWVYTGSNKHRDEALKMVEKAREFAEKAKKMLISEFPDWKVYCEALADSPAWGIIKKADHWKPDLIVLGSHGYSGLQQLMMGSVSQRVLHHVQGPVRISRGRKNEIHSPLNIVIAMDGSVEAQKAVQVVCARQWHEGTRVYLITAVDAKLSTEIFHTESHGKKWFRADDQDSRAWIKRMLDASADLLQKKGLIALSLIKEGDPKHVLLDESKKLDADCIFMGSRGLGALNRLFLGSVASVVAQRAHCSVEIHQL